MKTSWVKYILAALIAGAIAYVALIHMLPRLEMSAAMDQFSSKAARVNAFVPQRRIGDQSRLRGRPSADFAIFTCVYDLDKGPLLISSDPWRDYWALTFYGANGDAFYSMNDREAPRGARLLLMRAGKKAPPTPLHIVESPSRRGVAMLRRLAPSPRDYDEAVAAARSDSCAPFDAPKPS